MGGWSCGQASMIIISFPEHNSATGRNKGYFTQRQGE